jgi:hypothetical protein
VLELVDQLTTEDAVYEGQRDDLAKRMADDMWQIAEQDDGRVHHIKATVGLGKTRAGIDIAWAYKGALVVPDHASITGSADILRYGIEEEGVRDGFVHVEGLLRKPCVHMKKAFVLEGKHLSSAPAHNTPCAFNRKISGMAALYVHQHLFTYRPWLHRLVAVDDMPRSALFSTITLDLSHYKRDFRRGTLEFAFMEAAHNVISQYFKGAYNTVDKHGVKGFIHYYGMLGCDFMDEINNKMGGRLYDHLMRFKGRHSLDGLRPAPNTKMLDSRTIHLQKRGDFFLLAHAMYEESEHLTSRLPWNSHISLSKYGEGIQITRKLVLPEERPTILFLSATADARDLEAFFGCEVVSHKYEIGPYPSTRYVAVDTERIISKSDFDNQHVNPGSYKYDVMVDRENRRIRFGLDALGVDTVEDSALITSKVNEQDSAVARGLRPSEYPEGEPEVIYDTMHHGNMLGKNGLQDKGQLTILGEHILPQSEYMRQSHARYHDDEVAVLSMADERAKETRETSIQDELDQEAGRLRSVRKPNTKLLTVGTRVANIGVEPELIVAKTPPLDANGKVIVERCPEYQEQCFRDIEEAEKRFMAQGKGCTYDDLERETGHRRATISRYRKWKAESEAA